MKVMIMIMILLVILILIMCNNIIINDNIINNVK